MAEASTVPTVDTYNKYYQAVLAGLQGENGFQDRPDSQLKNYLTKIMRPTYDQAIRQRQLQTGQNRAAIDADAASRGMGTSSWLTDAKMRQGTQEARDIADIENSYNSALYEALLAQMQQRDQNRLSLMNMASGLAGNLYAQDQAAKNSGGGGGYSSGRRRGSHNSNSGPGPAGSPEGPTSTEYTITNPTVFAHELGQLTNGNKLTEKPTYTSTGYTPKTYSNKDSQAYHTRVTPTATTTTTTTGPRKTSTSTRKK